MRTGPDVPRIEAAEYRAVSLRVHSLLADVPLHDVWAVELSGRPEAVTLDDLQRAVRQEPSTRRLPLAARALFGLRHLLGRVLRIDDPPPGAEAAAFAKRLTTEDRARSLVAPGTPEGPFRVVYRFENEALLEAHNRTVHAALLTALERTGAGCRFYLAVYVCDSGWTTRAYMALIDPFRRWIIYPALLKSVRAIGAKIAPDS